MKRFGLIGYPVKGSLSPLLFSAGYHGKYGYDLIEKPVFEEAYALFLSEYHGVNVTAPFKEYAFAKAGTVSPVCRKIGATNLLVKTGTGISACNSDYTGIRMSILENLLPQLKGEDSRNAAGMIQSAYGHIPQALVVGCGGAGRAAAVAAAELGMHTVLMNRTTARAEAIAGQLPEYGFGISGIEYFPEVFHQSDIIIYTLPGKLETLDAAVSGQGMARDRERTGPKLILEANYKTPSFTHAAIDALRGEYPGLRYISGLRWLLHQAAGGYRLFTGEEPDFKAMEQALTNHL